MDARLVARRARRLRRPRRAAAPAGQARPARQACQARPRQARPASEPAAGVVGALGAPAWRALGLSEAEAFEAWCVGRTGAPPVDAAMAQLWVTG